MCAGLKSTCLRGEGGGDNYMGQLSFKRAVFTYKVHSGDIKDKVMNQNSNKPQVGKLVIDSGLLYKILKSYYALLYSTW